MSLCDPMDYTVHGILQARLLEWVVFPFFKGSSQPRDQTHVLCIRQILYQLSHKGSPRILEWVTIPSPGDLPNPGIKPGLLHYRQILYQLSYDGRSFLLIHSDVSYFH